MRILMFKESSTEIRSDDRFLCPSCNNSLMIPTSSEDLYQCDDVYCSKLHYLWDMNIIARKEDKK